jgi:hypothetical protein
MTKEDVQTPLTHHASATTISVPLSITVRPTNKNSIAILVRYSRVGFTVDLRNLVGDDRKRGILLSRKHTINLVHDLIDAYAFFRRECFANDDKSPNVGTVCVVFRVDESGGVTRLSGCERRAVCFVEPAHF